MTSTPDAEKPPAVFARFFSESAELQSLNLGVFIRFNFMQTNQTTTAAAPQTMHVFRKQEHEREFVWIYKGEVDVETKETTFGQLLPSDRVSNYFPEENYECEEMPEAGGMICSI